MSTQVSKWGKTLILAAIVFVVGPAVFYYEWSYKGKREDQEEQGKKLFNLKDQGAARIDVVDGPRRFTFKCADLAQKLCKAGDNSKWELTEPIKARGDDSNVNGLVSSIANLAPEESIDLNDDTPEKRAALLREYRLDENARKSEGSRRIEVTFADGKSRTLYIGDTHPVGEAYFGAIADEGKFKDTRVYLVPQFFKASIDHDLTFWRDKKLLTLAAHQIHGFSLDSKKVNATGERKDGEWKLKLPGGEEVPGDIENIDNLLTGATYLQAKEFASEDKSDAKAKKILAGTRKYLTLTLKTEKSANEKGEPQPVVLTILEKNDGKAPLYATVSTADPLYALELTSKDRIDKTLKDLRLQKLVTSTERFTARELLFEGKPLGGATLKLVQDAGKWVNATDKNQEIDPEKVQILLDKLSGNRIQEFLAGGKVPSGEEFGLRMTLSGEKGAEKGDGKSEKKREYVFWKSGGKLYARDLAVKRKEALLVENSVGDALPWTADAFVKKAPPAPAASAKPAPPSKK